MSQSARIEAALGQLSLTYTEFVGMNEEELRRHWRALMKRAHPDLAGQHGQAGDAASINAAFDSLKLALKERARLERHQPRAAAAPYRPPYDRNALAPPWQPDKQAKNHRIHVESYRDQNFIKKRIWELSDHSEEIYTIDAFGKSSFEGRTRVYGSQAVFDEMAKAMLIWNANGGNLQLTRAVLVSSAKQSHRLFLIYADGKSLADNPIPLDYDATAGSHYQDKNFQTRLPTILDRIAEVLAARE